MFKQLTYVRNVIQQNFDLLIGPSLPRPCRFFISACVDETLDFGHNNMKPRFTNQIPVNQRFAGPLFDRATLLLQAYNINFLYMRNACVAGIATQRDNFRSCPRQLFRDH